MHVYGIIRKDTYDDFVIWILDASNHPLNLSFLYAETINNQIPLK